MPKCNSYESKKNIADGTRLNPKYQDQKSETSSQALNRGRFNDYLR